MSTKKGNWLALLLLMLVLVACGGGGSDAPTSPSAVTSPAAGSPAGIMTRAETVKAALQEHGYANIATADDALYDTTGRKLCGTAQQGVATMGDPAVRSIGKGFIEGLGSAGTGYTADDGAVMVELFLQTYCPDVLNL